MADSGLSLSGCRPDSSGAADRIQKLYKRLARRADEVERCERQLDRAREERDKVIYELLDHNEPERGIAWAAGISGPAVHQIKDRRAA